MIELYSNMGKHEYEPGDPRATSGQGYVQCQKQDIESTYHDVLLMKTQCCRHGNSSHFHFFHFFIEQDARTSTNSKTRYGLRKNLLRGTHIPPPHLEFAKLQVYGVQVSFYSCSFIKAYRGVVVGVALMFVGVACPSFFLIFPWKGQRPKIPEGKLYPRTCPCFLLKEK